jgi:chloramphenicol O-acetyltransferase type A
MAVVCALQPIPNRGAGIRGDLFSVALSSSPMSRSTPQTPPTARQRLNMQAHPRRAAFEFFRAFNQPFFSVCVRVDVSALKPALRSAGRGSVTLATHFVALSVARALPPWRTRLDGDGVVWLYERAHASTTVLKADGSFGFALLADQDRFDAFCAGAAPALAAARDRDDSFEPLDDELPLIHCTTLPWLHFTQFSHARRIGGDGLADSCPKLAFGRIDRDGQGREWMPLAIDAHHALMDGALAGAFVARFEAAMRAPAGWIGGGPLPEPG